MSKEDIVNKLPKVPPSSSPKDIIYISSGEKSVNNSLIGECMAKLVYVWQIDGKGYWAYLNDTNGCLVMGYKWSKRRWKKLKIYICQIYNVICYS